MFIVVIMCVVSLVYAGGIALSGVGTRAKSMGGAMRGLADDASAMYWNPAGLAFLTETTVTAGVHYVDFTGEWEHEVDSMMVTTENEDVTNIIPSFVYANCQKDRSWNWGIGLYVPFGLSANWDIYQQPDSMYVEAYNINVPLEWPGVIEENDLYGSMQVFDLHPSFGFKLSEKTAIGFGLSAYYSTIEIDKVKEHDVYGALLPTYLQLEGSGMAMGANFGVMCKPIDDLTVGISGRLNTKMKLEGDAQIDTYINDALATGMGIPSDIYSANPDVEATLTLPADMGFGLSYNIKDNWLVAADFTYTWWEEFDTITIDFAEGDSLLGLPIEDDELVMNWENTIRVSIGTEYLFNQFAIRAGYYYDESPLVDETMTTLFPDFNTKNALNFGLGYEITKKLCVDLGLEYIMFEEREITEQTEENWLGTYNATLYDIMIDFTWKF